MMLIFLICLLFIYCFCFVACTADLHVKSIDYLLIQLVTKNFVSRHLKTIDNIIKLFLVNVISLDRLIQCQETHLACRSRLSLSISVVNYWKLRLIRYRGMFNIRIGNEFVILKWLCNFQWVPNTTLKKV